MNNETRIPNNNMKDIINELSYQEIQEIEQSESEPPKGKQLMSVLAKKNVSHYHFAEWLVDLGGVK
jgi:hypothetical protein